MLKVRKIHNQLGHISNEKLIKLMKKAGYPPRLTKLVKNFFCPTCAKRRPPYRRSVIHAAERVAQFNHHIEMDILIPRKGTNILHIRDTWSRFSGAQLLENRSADSICAAFIECWLANFGCPRIITIDGEGACISDDFQNLCSALNIEIRLASPDAHWQMPIVERGNKILEDLILNIQEEKKINGDNLSFFTIVKLAVCAMNSSPLACSRTPNEFVFGERDGLSTAAIKNHLISIPEQIRRRFAMLENLQERAQSMAAKSKIARALAARPASKVTPFLNFKANDFVDIYNKKDGWSGPYRLLAQASEKSFWILKGARVLVRAVEHLRYHIFHDEEIDIIHRNENFYCSNEENNPGGCSSTVASTFVTVVNAKEATGPAWTAADKKEIDGIIANETFAVEHEKDVPPNASYINTGVVRVLKDAVGAPATIPKSRWVAKEYNSNRVVERSVPTPGKEIVRLMINLSLLFSSPLRTFDVRQAFLQGNKIVEPTYLRLPRDKKFLELIPENLRAPGTVLRLIKPIYGMVDSGNRWVAKFFDILKGLNYIQCPPAPTLWYLKDKNGRIKSIVCIYIDDGLYFVLGNDDLLANVKKQIVIGASKTMSPGDKFAFLGAPICCAGENNLITEYKIDLNEYAAKIEPILIPKDQKSKLEEPLNDELLNKFRALLGQLGWISLNSKPQLACALSQTASDERNIKKLKELNGIVENFDKTNNVLTFKKLKIVNDEIFLYVYSDASLQNNSDASTQSGWIVFIGGPFEDVDSNLLEVNVLDWRSRKLRRITRSTFASELLSFEEAADKAVYLKQILKPFFRKVNLIFLLDCQSIVSNIFALNPTTTEWRLRADLMLLRETLREELAEVFHVNGEHQAADCLTKKEKFNRFLHDILRTNTIDTSTFNRFFK